VSPDRKAQLRRLGETIAACRLCPRLVSFRESVPERAAFRGQEYWRRPLTGFGDPDAWLMVIGLAPAAHGGNRTGRVFTGDESAKFLMRALHRAGFASQPTSLSRDDGLRLEGCYITAAVRCVPPDNRPSPAEFANCSRYLDREFELLTNLRAVLALGQLAFKAYLGYARSRGHGVGGVRFSHGSRVEFRGIPSLYGSYHPSPRNTYTGKLSQSMLVEVLEAAKADRRSGQPSA
jgi:uracil-DNA glycosylase family 4